MEISGAGLTGVRKKFSTGGPWELPRAAFFPFGSAIRRILRFPGKTIRRNLRLFFGGVQFTCFSKSAIILIPNGLWNPAFFCEALEHYMRTGGQGGAFMMP
ncbi:MAG: hypothetical protein DRP71_09065 [Verrucomicrobia bacterium]|nr:MAG: hypothetical protein DRP71_09065 [Verrucomicrobiota bacterium]